MKVGDLVVWTDYNENLRHGLIMSEQRRDKYYEVLIDGNIKFCHEINLEVISESR